MAEIVKMYRLNTDASVKLIEVLRYKIIMWEHYQLMLLSKQTFQKAYHDWLSLVWFIESSLVSLHTQLILLPCKSRK
jgi:hypothetical protein